VLLTCADSDTALRALLAAEPNARDIEVTGADLEDAFMALTTEETS
jgi:ABC-2 type transport system ATP-binding protein